MLSEMLKKSGTYSVATFATRLTSLIMIPVYTRYLTRAEYGVLSLIDVTMMLFTLFFSVKMGQSLLYHYANSKDEKTRDRYICTAFIGACAIGVFGGLVGQALAPILGPWVLGVPQAGFYFSITMLTFMCSFPIEIGLALMRAQNKPSYYTAASLFRLFSGVVLNVITIVILRMGVTGMLISALITSVLLVLYMTWYVLRSVSFAVDLHTARKLMRYSLPLLVSAGAIFLINSADRLVLRHYVSLDEVGLYALAYRLGMLVSYVYTPIELYWSSQMFVALKQPDGHTGYARAATYVMLIGTVVTLCLSVFARPALQIAVPTFQASAKYVPWVALACLIRALAAFCRSAIYVEGRTRLEARVTVTSALICLAGYALLIPRYGSWGAIAATLMGVGSLLVLGQWFAQRLRRIRFEYRRITQIALCATVVILLNNAAAPNSIAAQFAVGIALLMAFPVLLAFSGFFNEEERRRIVGWLRQLRQSALPSRA